MSPETCPPAAATSWTWSDLTVAAALFIAVCLLIFPAIQRARMNARLVACQENLHQLGGGMAQVDAAYPKAAGRFTPVAGLNSAGVRMSALVPQLGAVDPRPIRPVGIRSRNAASQPNYLVGSFSNHQGFTQSVRGQNLLFADGRAAFLAMGPAIDPAVNDAAQGVMVDLSERDRGPADWFRNSAQDAESR